MKIYSIYHIYEVDGGFGDSILKEEHVITLESETDAKEFIDKYNHPYAYDKIYDEMYCNKYTIRETETISHKSFNINKAPKDYGIYIPKANK